MWQVISNVNFSGSTGTCAPGDTSIMGSLSFVSYWGEWYNQFGAGPFPVVGGTYSGGVLTDPLQLVPGLSHNNNVHSNFCFDVNVPLGCAGLIGIDIEIQNPADVASDGNHAGSHPFFIITDVVECPVNPNTSLQIGPDTSVVGYACLNPTHLRKTLLAYLPATFTPSGSTTKRFAIGFVNDYRIADVKYTLHDVFWRNV